MRLGSLLGMALALSLVPSAAFAQAIGKQLGGPEDVSKFNSQYKFKLFGYLAGREAPSNADVLDGAAKFYVYRVTWNTPDPESRQYVVNEFGKHIDQILTPLFLKENKDFIKAYAPRLVAHFRELTDLPVVGNSVSIIYGLQMLPQLARLKDPSIDRYLVELLDKDKSSPGYDVVRLWSLRALRESLPVQAWGHPLNAFDFKNKANLAKKQVDLSIVDGITGLIFRPIPADLPADQVGAHLYLRREAIETLAQAGAAAVNSLSKEAKVEGPIAPTLLKVLIPGMLSPEPSLAERNEAALGLCHLQKQYVADEYQGGATVHYIGKTLLDLTREYNEDFPVLSVKKGVGQFPWKIVAKRWESALADLPKTVSKDKVASQHAKELADFAKMHILPKMYATTAITQQLGLDAIVTKIGQPKMPILLFKNRPELAVGAK